MLAGVRIVYTGVISTLLKAANTGVFNAVSGLPDANNFQSVPRTHISALGFRQKGFVLTDGQMQAGILAFFLWGAASAMLALRGRVATAATRPTFKIFMKCSELVCCYERKP